MILQHRLNVSCDIPLTSYKVFHALPSPETRLHMIY